MQIIESFIAITHRVIARDGFDGYLQTLMLPVAQEVLNLEGVTAGVRRAVEAL